MVERKSGPVKPPILDLEARKAAGEKADPAKKPAAKPSPKKPQPSAAKPEGESKKASVPSPSFPLVPVLSATLLGTVCGAALAFGIAAYGLWPNPQPDMAINPNRVSTLEGQVTEITSTNAQTNAALKTLTEQVATSETDRDANAINPQTIEDLQAEVSALADQVSALSDNVATTEPIDITGITRQIAAIETQLSAVAAGSSGDGATELVETLEQARAEILANQSEIATLTSRLLDTEGSMDDEAATTRARIEELQQQVTTNASRTPPPTDSGTQIPLALSGLEEAILQGRPFLAELRALETALPDITVPQSVANSAAQGLPTSLQITDALNAIIPAMLLAKPSAPDASWQDNLRDRFTALLVLRPTGEIAGDTPEAIIARLENAINQRDFILANTAFLTLPSEMQTAADTIAEPLGALADAQHFARSARAAALQSMTTNGEANS